MSYSLASFPSQYPANALERFMNSIPEKPQTPSPAPVKRKSSWKGTVIAVAAVVALGGLAWYLTHRPAAGPAGMSAGAPGGPGGPGMMGGRRGGPATTVGVATAEKADIPVIIDALGTVTARAIATVRPQVSGVLTDVKYREGQMVKAGQVLAVIDPRPFDIALAQATGQRQRDEAQLENAKLMLERFRTLLSQDSIAKQDVDTQAALVKQLDGTVAADRAAERTARLNLDYSQIKAPISGRVGLRVVDVGNTVSSGDTTGIAVITETAPIDVQFSIPQDRIGELRASIEKAGDRKDGQALSVTALDRTRATVLDTGRFLAMDNQVDATTGTVRAKASFANEKGALFPSQFVNVRMVLRTVEGAVTVPVNALRHSSTGDYVYVLDAKAHTVALRKVTSGMATVDKVQVLSGLNAGEQVITEGADRLKDGASVVLPGDKPSGNRRQRPGGGAATDAAQQGGQNGSGGERRRKRDAVAENGAPPTDSAQAAQGNAGNAAAPNAEAVPQGTPVSEDAAERRRRWREAHGSADATQQGGEPRRRRENGNVGGNGGSNGGNNASAGAATQ
jgi:multidrug efflux system membrane fusion protein